MRQPSQCKMRSHGVVERLNIGENGTGLSFTLMQLEKILSLWRKLRRFCVIRFLTDKFTGAQVHTNSEIFHVLWSPLNVLRYAHCQCECRSTSKGILNYGQKRCFSHGEQKV